MRVEHEGMWAEISEKPLTWGQRNVVRSAANKDFFNDFAPAIVTTVVTAWSEKGNPQIVSSWDDIDAEFGDKVFAAALKLWSAKAEEVDPKSDTPVTSES